MCGDEKQCDYLEQVKQYRKEYYQKHKETMNKQTYNYYINNREHVLELQKNYRSKNLESINAARNQKCECECGGKFTFTNRSRHLISKKHLKWANPGVTENTNQDKS